MDRNKTRELDTVSFLIHFSATVGILHHFILGAGHRVDASQGSDISTQNCATPAFLWSLRSQGRLANHEISETRRGATGFYFWEFSTDFWM